MRPNKQEYLSLSMILKIFFSEAITGMKLNLCVHVNDIYSVHKHFWYCLFNWLLWQFTVPLLFNSHKSVQKLFHNLHIIFSNSLIDFKVICQLEKEPLKGLAHVQEILSLTISLVIDLQ